MQTFIKSMHENLQSLVSFANSSRFCYLQIMQCPHSLGNWNACFFNTNLAGLNHNMLCVWINVVGDSIFSYVYIFGTRYQKLGSVGMKNK